MTSEAKLESETETETETKLRDFLDRIALDKSKRKETRPTKLRVVFERSLDNTHTAWIDDGYEFFDTQHSLAFNCWIKLRNQSERPDYILETLRAVIASFNCECKTWSLSASFDETTQHIQYAVDQKVDLYRYYLWLSFVSKDPHVVAANKDALLSDEGLEAQFH